MGQHWQQSLWLNNCSTFCVNCLLHAVTSFIRIITQQTSQNFMQFLCNTCTKAVQLMTVTENVLTERSRSTHSESTGMCHHAAAATLTTWTPYLCYVIFSTLHLQFGRFFIPENQFLHWCLSTERIGSDSDSLVRIKHTLFFFLTFRGPCIIDIFL
jgi:hypothetical protein